MVETSTKESDAESRSDTTLQQNGAVKTEPYIPTDNGHISTVQNRKPANRKTNGNNKFSSSEIPERAFDPPDRNEIINLSVLPSFVNAAGVFMLVWPVMFVWAFWVACHSYRCSLGMMGSDLISALRDLTILRYIRDNIPAVTPKSLVVYFVWMMLQIILYLTLPGKKAQGQVTPAGHQLTYTCNGLNAWIVSHVAFLALVFAGVIQMSVIADHWGSLMVIANCFGLFLSCFAYLKALYFPTHPSDRCFSGSFFYDFYMGVELNPRIGAFDFKLFFNGRPGIAAWTLINLSFAAKQYSTYGFVTNSMILVNILHAMYVIDYFMNEDWYLRTIDIAYDHFGFMLAWGDNVWLPFMYTLQSCYLLYNPIILPWWGVIFVLTLGLSGYTMFRLINTQKDYFRQEMCKSGKCVIWGRPAKYIPASYTTSLGEHKQTYLLASGWWGQARHLNYLADFMNAFSYGLACGFGHFLPYFYFFFIFFLLLHRSHRDDIKCRQKYGAAWQQYCKLVPYKIVPYLY